MKITLSRFVTGAAAAAGIGLLGALAPALASPEPPHPSTTVAPLSTIEATTTTVTTATEPTTTEPSTTEPSTTEPTRVTRPQLTEPSTTRPVSSEPPTTEATTEATTKPAPQSTSDRPAGDETPASLQLSCAISDGRNVSCSWKGDVPASAVRLLILRGEVAGKGRLVGEFSDPHRQSATDANVPAGSFSFVVVLLDAAGKTVAHSQGVPIS